MTQELRFKVWDVDNSKMYVLSDIFKSDFLQNTLHTLLYVNDDCVNGKGNLVFLQYVGLEDVDNVPIFNGDILEYVDDPGEYCRVEHYGGAFRTGRMDIMEAESLEMIGYRVVGNIYENPDLM